MRTSQITPHSVGKKGEGMNRKEEMKRFNFVRLQLRKGQKKAKEVRRER